MEAYGGLKVLCEAAISVDTSEKPFHHPAPCMHEEADLAFGLAHDLDDPNQSRALN